jgi:hypothetical protein
MKRWSLGVSALTLLISTVVHGQASGYFLDRMPTVPGTTTAYVSGINETGSIAVTAYPNSGGAQADVITGSKVVTEPGMGINNAPVLNYMEMRGINNTGGATGDGYNYANHYRAVYWDANGNPWELIPPDGTDSPSDTDAIAINDNHIIVGYTERTDYSGVDAMIWRSGYTSDAHVLPTLNGATYGSTIPTAIARTAEYVSAVYYSGDTEYAIKYFNGKIVAAIPNAGGQGVNDQGVMVGWLTVPVKCPDGSVGCTNQFPMKDGRILASLSNYSSAQAINNAGVIVGFSNGHAVKWSASGTITDLNTLMSAQVPKGTTLTQGAQITDSGRIFVTGYNNVNVVYYQLTPAIPNSIKISSNINPSSYGQPIHLVASVIPSQKSAPVPQGALQWYDNGKLLGSAGLTAIGTSSWEPSTWAPGKHTITVSYAGYSPNASGTSAGFSQTINVASTKMGLSASATTITHGQSVKLTATVVPSFGTIAGTVTFKNGSTILGTATVNGSTKQATLSPVLKTAGKYSITASYAATANYAGSTSSAVSVTVK